MALVAVKPAVIVLHTLCVNSQHSQLEGLCPTSCSSDHHHHSSGRSSCSRCGPALMGQKRDSSSPSHTHKHTQVYFTVEPTFYSVHYIFLVGCNVKVLNNRVHSGDGGGLHHCCLLQTAYAGLWWSQGGKLVRLKHIVYWDCNKDYCKLNEKHIHYFFRKKHLKTPNHYIKFYCMVVTLVAAFIHL